MDKRNLRRSRFDDAGKKLLDHARNFVAESVRLVLAPETRTGTIQDAHLEYGRLEYFFHLDPRFKPKIPSVDFFVEEGDFEICEILTDEYVRTVNFLIDYGTGKFQFLVTGPDTGLSS